MSSNFCQQCFDLKRQVDDAKAENERLKDKIRYMEQGKNEGVFGSSTPSSKKSFKPCSPLKETPRMGGAKKGHKGFGRTKDDVTQHEYVALDDGCPDCGGPLQKRGDRQRLVKDIKPPRPDVIEYACERGFCPRCKKHHTAKQSSVLPRMLFGNGLLSHVTSLHYEQGIPLGRIEEMYGLNHGTILQALHRLGDFIDPAVTLLLKQLRKDTVINADESTWRTDGNNGYVWLFCSEKTSVFHFTNTRASSVAKDILGEKCLPGCLVRDRYAGYNKILGRQQYCYAHLLRDVTDLSDEFPGNQDVENFVEQMAILLSDAIKLRNRKIGDKIYYQKAQGLKEQILHLVYSDVEHMAVKGFQDIFKKSQHRLFEWVEDRGVPADNNRAERELRPVVIARKTSFGSQSVRGAKTRSILMTLINTVKKRHKDKTFTEWFKALLDEWVANPRLTPKKILGLIGD